MLPAPRTDPYVRNYRIRLLPWMMTTKAALRKGLLLARPAVRATWMPGSESGPGATAPALSSVSLLPSTDSADSEPLSLFARFAGTMKLSDSPETCMSDLWLMPSPTDPLREQRMLPGSLGFREKGFQPCEWSQTP